MCLKKKPTRAQIFPLQSRNKNPYNVFIDLLAYGFDENRTLVNIGFEQVVALVSFPIYVPTCRSERQHRIEIIFVA